MTGIKDNEGLPENYYESLALFFKYSKSEIVLEENCIDESELIQLQSNFKAIDERKSKWNSFLWLTFNTMNCFV